MNRKISTHALIFGALGVVVNIVGNYLALATNSSVFFLDAIGTIFVAVLFGPFLGGLVGVVTNLVLGVISSPISIPFALVNLVIGLVTGWLAKKRAFTLSTAILTGLILSILAPLVGTPIVVALFGGLTGGGIDLITVWLIQSGREIFGATFISRVISNLIDKVGSCILVYLMIRALPDVLKVDRNRAA